MPLLKALRISQNGKPGTVFEAEGQRVKQLTTGPNPIAELYQGEAKTDELDLDALDAELDAPTQEKAIDVAPENKVAPAPKNKGGKKPKAASKK